MGKTTLLKSGAEAAGSGLVVLRTMPAPGDMRLAFSGLGDLLEGHLPDLIGVLNPPQARALQVALLLQEAPPHPPEPRAIAAAFRSAVLTLAQSSPVLLVIDDVQWLDPASVAAVGYAVRRIGHEPVGLLCAQRTTEPGAELPLELGRAELPVGLLPVGGMSLGALHRMLRTQLDAIFSRPVLRRIEADSRGNPFMALEIGRALLRRGDVSVLSSALPVPRALASLIDERLGALGPEVMDALGLVAISPDATAEMCVAAGADSAALDRAVVAGVLAHEAGRLRFTHPLLAATVADAIPPGRQRELHAAAARVARHPEQRARHRAVSCAGRSETVAAELEAAAHAAADRGAPAAAAELFSLAAALTPDNLAADVRRRQLHAARQLAYAGDAHAATASLEQLAAATPPGPARVGALMELGKLMEDMAAAAVVLEQALAEAADAPACAAEVRLALADLWLRRGEGERALAEARAALPDAEASGSPVLLATVLAQVFDYGLMHGGYADEQLLIRALELEGETDRLLFEFPPSWTAGLWHLLIGRLDEAEQEFRRVLARAEAGGDELAQSDLLLRLAQVAARRGEYARSAALAASSLELAEQLDLAHPTCAALHGCAAAASVLGDVEAARAFAIRGAQLAGATGDQPYQVLNEAVLGSVDVVLGHHAAAAERLKPLAGRLNVAGVRPTTQAIRADAVDALVAIGELDEAARIATELDRSSREPVTAALAARCRGIVAAARGDTNLALRELARAIALHTEVSPIPLEQGRTLLALGIVQRRLKQRADSRSTLAEALTIFEKMDARLWAARARDELARISGRAPGPGDLTATEQKVAELVARGKNNRDIAAELFVTVRAVESTLTKTYAKLGVRSRTELAARLAHGEAAR